MNFVAVEVETTGWCPLNCSYCYIPKTEEMKKLHARIVGMLRDGTILNNLLEAPIKIEHLGFWGTEPALTIRFLSGYVREICKRHPLKEIGYSTSMILDPKPFIDFFREIGGTGVRAIRHQVSLDGPAWITDVNRAPGVTEKVIANMKKMIGELNKLDLDFTIKIPWKATLSIENIRQMVERPHLIHEYFDFFNRLTEELRSLNRNPRVVIENTSSPTLVVPGKYTTDDGKTLARFFELLREMGYPNTYVFRLMRVWKYRDELHKARMFTCSGGDTNCGFDGRNIHICHRTFYYERDEYVSSILSMPKYRNWDVSVLEQGGVENIRKWYIVPYNDGYQLARFRYVMRGYHDFWRMRLASTYALIKELALSGQASEVYLRDDRMAELLALFVNTALSCPMENLLNTGSVHIPPISLVRLFANGAFEILVEEVRKIVGGRVPEGE